MIHKYTSLLGENSSLRRKNTINRRNIFTNIKNYIPQIFWGFIFGGIIFFLSQMTGTAGLFADLSIPYSDASAGLNTNIHTDNAITQKSVDNGAEGVVNVLTTVFFFMKIILGILAVVWIVWAGVYTISNSGNEENVTKGKRMVTYTILGLAVMILSEPLILDVFYGGGDLNMGGDGNVYAVDGQGINQLAQSTKNFRLQLDGVIAFFKTLLVFIAMGYLILTGARMVFAFGEDEELTTAKSMFLPIIGGILVILFNEVFVDLVLYDIIFDGGNYDNSQVQFSPDSSNVQVFVEQLVGFLKYFFEFVGFIVLGFIIYGGFLYISSFGEDETAEKGKNIIIRAAIGMLILLFSFVLMTSLVSFQLF